MIENSDIDNVIFVVADSLRVDTVSNWMPNVQKLCESNVEFTSCYSVGPHTPSSMSGIVQSRLPIDGGYGMRLPSSPPTIAEQLAVEDDVICAGWHCNPHTIAEREFNRGFTIYSDLHKQPPFYDPSEQADTDGTDSGGSPLRHRIKQTASALRIRPVVDKSAGILKRIGLLGVDPRVPAEKTVEAFERWVSGSTHDKRFAHLHFMDTHVPYKPPDSHWKHSRIDEISSRRAQSLYRKLQDDEYNLNQRELTDLRRLYHAEAEYTDRQISRLVRTLKSEDMWDSSVLIFTSDHGELFGEKQAPDGSDTVHPSYLCEELVHVPLVVAGGGVCSRVDSSLVSGYDIAPTIVKALDVAPAEEWQGKPLGEGGYDYVISTVASPPGGPADEIDSDWLHVSVRTDEHSVLFWRNSTPTEYYNRDGSETPDHSPDPEEYELEMEIARSYRDVPLDLEGDKTTAAKERLEDLGYVKFFISRHQRTPHPMYHDESYIDSVISVRPDQCCSRRAGHAPKGRLRRAVWVASGDLL